MRDSELLDLVSQMREKQRRWFKFKNLPDLQDSKRLEGEVDKALAERARGQEAFL